MRISKKKQEKISEQMLNFLYHQFPKSFYTSQISEECARDEEFMLKLLKELETSRLVVAIKKNPSGKDYKRRIKWRLSNQAYDVYKQHQ